MRTFTDAEIAYWGGLYQALDLDRVVAFADFIAKPHATVRYVTGRFPQWAERRRATPTAIAAHFDERSSEQKTAGNAEAGIAVHREHEWRAQRFQGGCDVALA